MPEKDQKKSDDVSVLLKEHLESAENWERMETSIPSLFVVKIGETKTKGASLALEINPINEMGKPTKKNGLFIRPNDDVSVYLDTLNNPKFKATLEEIAKICGGSKQSTKKKIIKL